MNNIIIEKYNSNKKIEWDNFVDNSKNGTFILKRDYMDYHSDRFLDNSLMFYENDLLISVLPLSINGNILASHGGLTYGGFITNEKMKQVRMNKCFEALLEYAKQNKVERIIYKPIPYIYSKFPAQEDLYSLFINSAILISRNISSTIDLKKIIKLPKGRKAQISRAKREQVCVEESFDFENFIKLENEVLAMYHNTKAVHTGNELNLLKSRFNDNIHLYIAKQNGDLIAGAVIFEFEDLVHTQYLASNELGREIGALDLIISMLIDKYQKNKKYFDFGISNENNGYYLNEGLISQKESFGGRGVVYDCYELEV